ncbi:MAG: AAA family ATPase [Clostridia bacterium]|nr:AAA family ATPase [Clostridia bacterium]
MNKLETINALDLLYNPLEQVEYIIQDILPTGLHLFCGASKIGKSWLMLKMCLQVSKGEEIWGLKTKESEVLYLCLEDTFARIQSRLFKLTDEANEKLNFTISTNKISNGLVMQLEEYIKQKPNTRLIVIDTLQKIRNQSADSSYASDYGDISIMKNLADKYKIAIVLVHHIRKQNDNDIFNRVSGTTGIMGSSDTTFILEKKSREDNTAKLYMTGRDVEYQEFTLKFENCNWELVERQKQEDIQKQKVPSVIYKVIDFMQDKEEWKGTATELLQELAETEVAPNVITKVLNEYHTTELKDNSILYSVNRNNKNRQIILTNEKLVTASKNFYENVTVDFKFL